MSSAHSNDSRCDGCGTTIEPSRGGRRRRCSDSCRKQTLYSGTCIDCGGRTRYSGTATPPERCAECAQRHNSETARWTRETIIADLHRWHDLTGRWPLTSDWNRYQVKNAERRALLDRLHEATGPWPHIFRVQEVFGSWRAALAEVGADAQPAHSGGPVGEGSREADRMELQRLVDRIAA